MNLLIVDEEPAVRASLTELCGRRSDLRVVGELTSGAKAVHAAESLRPDLVFLGAELPDMTGFDVLRALRVRDRRRTIMLCSSCEDAENAFAVGAADFLTKPVSPEAFSSSILRAREILKDRIARARRASKLAMWQELGNGNQQRQPLLLIGEREHRLYPLDPQKIDYIESAGNYVQYRSNTTDYIARESIGRLDELLSPLGFVRIERSLLLNMRAIAYAQPVGHGTFVFTLTSGTQLRSGPAYRDTILGALPLRRRAAKRNSDGSLADRLLIAT